MSEYFNTFFDDSFKNITSLKWLPWVGRNYSNQQNRKLLLVAESHYDWGQEGALDDLDYPEFTRWFIKGHTFDNPNSTMKVLRNTERALFGGNPSDTQKILFWESTAYFNIVQLILSNINERPNDSDYLIGWETFFCVIDILKPDYCLFCGVEASNFTLNFNNALQKHNYRSEGIRWCSLIGSTYSRIADLHNESGYQCKLIFMKHPSKYFSWRSWSEFIEEHMGDYIVPQD